MSEEFGNDFVTLVDEDGEEFVLETLDTIEYNGKTYGAFLPADMDENDPDYGMVILQITEEDGEAYFDDIEDDDELNDVYDHFMILLYGDDEEE